MGEPIEQECPGNLKWNGLANYCDWPHLSPCIENTVYSDPDEVLFRTDLRLFGTYCPMIDIIDNPVHLAHPDCTKFFKCYNGVPIEQNCSAGLHWHTRADMCDWPELADCKNQLPAAFAVQREYKTCPMFTHDEDEAVHLPHPNCTQFYKCYMGDAFEMDCPTPLRWNIAKDRCDWPDQAQCIDGQAPAQ